MSEFESWNSYRSFARAVRRDWRYIRTPEQEVFLREVLRTSKKRIRDLKAGFGLWRAQLGCRLQPEYHDGVYMGDSPAAYLPERMKPIPDRAKEGRANPKGIPVLYLATREITAMSEVRPWIGATLSCAHFETTRPLKVIDLSVNHANGSVFYFEEPDAAKKEEAVWTDIDQAFSEPTTTDDDTADYVPTQLIAELFKNEGFDGVVYKSAFGSDGYNIALFRLEDARVTTCILHEVKSAEFSFKQIDNPYWVNPDGTIKTLSIEILGPVQEKK